MADSSEHDIKNCGPQRDDNYLTSPATAAILFLEFSVQQINVRKYIDLSFVILEP